MVRNLPQVGLLAAGTGGAHVTLGMISAGQPHRATPLTGAMCLAAAMRLPGTLPHALAAPCAGDEDMVIAHPSGTLPVAATVRDGQVIETVVYRAARRPMEGRVLVPRGLLAGAAGPDAA